MRSLESLQDWEGAIRLAGVVATGAAVALVWVFRHDGGAWHERLRHALLVAWTPVLLAWPRRRRTPEKALCSSLGELEHLRRAGAI